MADFRIQQDGHSPNETVSYLASKFNGDDETEEEYADLTGTFSAYVALSPNFSAVRVSECAEAFLKSIRSMISTEAHGMTYAEQELLKSTAKFLFKDIFGMRAKTRIRILQSLLTLVSKYPDGPT